MERGRTRRACILEKMGEKRAEKEKVKVGER